MLFPIIFANMRLPLKHIVFLVIFSLIAIFSYQAYWLTGLYHTMKQEMERGINESMRMSDYNEMMTRVRRLRETYADAEKQVPGISSTTDTVMLANTHSAEVHTSLRDSADKTVGNAMLRANGSLDVILKDHNTMNDLAAYLQQGIHAGLNVLLDADVQCFDSFLTAELVNRGIDLPHRTLLVYNVAPPDAPKAFTDTLGIAGDSSYIPTRNARCYKYLYDLHQRYSYQLYMEPVTFIILKQMSGILATSFVIMLILGFSFWFLIRTIMKQKTLEEMKSDFTNNVTHELKTPIAVAYAANDALLNFNQAEEKEKRDKYLQIGQEQLQRLSGLVEQILTMSMENRKTFRLRPEEVELEPLIRSLAEQHRLKAGKPADISFSIEPEGLTVLADRTHFSNIVSNLVDNAVKYSPGKAVIDIRCRENDGKVEVSVTDQGLGIAAERQKHIFDKFYRVPTGNLHDVKGYGLGLYYVKTMVEKHGGTVSVKSETGRGSTFIITL